MGMTMTQKILASHANLESVTVGQLINAKLFIKGLLAQGFLHNIIEQVAYLTVKGCVINR